MEANPVKRLLYEEGNNTCSECLITKPNYVSTHLGIFLCPQCAKFHQKLGGKFNNVSNIQTHRFTDDEIDVIRCRGNLVNNNEYEKHVPVFYHRPGPEDPPLVFEQWMRAKYEREEFKYISQQSSYNQGTKTGTLLKRAKDEDKFQNRKFVLSEPDGNLMYYIKYSDKNPKDRISMKEIVNVYVMPSKIKHENGIQLTYMKNNKDRRNIYVYAKDGKTASDWYHAIRASLLSHKYKDFDLADSKKYLNTHIIREGWMTKTGPTRMEKFKRRWFSLEGSQIWYYKEPLDPYPLGVIHLGSKTFGYAVKKTFPKDVKMDGFGLTINTPERVFVLDCLNGSSRDRWFADIESVIESLTQKWVAVPGKSMDGSMIHRISSGSEQDEDSISSFPPPEVSQIQNGSVFTETQHQPIFEKKNGKAPSHNKNKYNKPSSATKKDATKKTFVFSEQTSKKFSDDSDSYTSDSDVVIAEPAPMEEPPKAHPRAAHLIKEITEGRQRIISSDTEEDSDQEVVIINKDGHEEVLSNSPSSSGRTTPKKPPRNKQLKSTSSAGSDLNNQGLMGSRESLDNVLRQPSPLTLQTHDNGVYAQMGSPVKDMDQLQIQDEAKWREKTFSSERRVQGIERKTVKKKISPVQNRSSTANSSPEHLQCRPIDITITNHVEENIWFLLFQCEENPNEHDSFTTPWIGAEIAETPASVGPIRLPNDFEIAVIDTAPGGHGLQRTTGPFYAEPGDVWEVDIPVDDGSAPDMFFHEGMETENGTVMVYNNVKNVKKFEVAIYKSGRKLFSRRNTRPGDAFTFSINPTLYIAAVDQDTFMDLEDEDIRVQDIIPNATPIAIKDKTKKIKISVKKRGNTIYFQSHLQKSAFATTSGLASDESAGLSL